MLAANGIPEAEAEKLAGDRISMRPGDSCGKGYLTYANGIHGTGTTCDFSDWNKPRT